MSNGPLNENNNDNDESIKKLQDSIKVLPENTANIKNNQINMPDSNSISNNFKNVKKILT